MTTKDDFTDEEWQLLWFAPAAVCMGVVQADESGAMARRKELAALAREVRTAQDQWAPSALAGQAATELDHREEYPQMLRHDHVREDVLLLANSIAELLEAKASPEEATNFERWLLHVAVEVARSAKEGGFLGTGLGGQAISEEEETFLRELAIALHLDEHELPDLEQQHD